MFNGYQVEISMEAILNRLMNETGIETQKELSEKVLNKDPSLISRWKSENRIPYDLIIEVCKQHRLNIPYILFGQHYATQPSFVSEQKTGGGDTTSVEYVNIPVYRSPTDNGDEKLLVDKLHFAEVISEDSVSMAAIVHPDNSMSKIFKKGAILICKRFESGVSPWPLDRFFSDGDIIVITNSNQFLVRRIQFDLLNRRMTLIPTNEHFMEHTIGIDESASLFTVWGKIIGSMNKIDG